MNKSLVQKALAVIIRFDPDEGCKLLVLELKSAGYEFYRLPDTILLAFTPETEAKCHRT